MLELGRGPTFGREGLSAALSRAGWSIKELVAAPWGGEGRWAPLPTSVPSPRGRAQRPPPVPHVGPVPSAVFFPAPLLPHDLLRQAQPSGPPRSLGSPPAWPSACRGADFSSQNRSLGPGRAGKRDFLTLLCLMLEERPARQN